MESHAPGLNIGPTQPARSRGLIKQKNSRLKEESGSRHGGTDFEYEKAIAQMNHALAPDIESIFIVSKPGYSSISSTIVRDILRHNGDVSQFIPKEALAYL